jgi:Dolichyl-phosphate-mannose-protein mannosyltransferase
MTVIKPARTARSAVRSTAMSVSGSVDEVSGTRQTKVTSKEFLAWFASSKRACWLLCSIVGISTVVIQGYRLSAGPDVFGDEGAYLIVGMHLANGMGLTGANGLFLWHPPLYMLIEAAWIKVWGLGNAQPLVALFDVRWINVVFSAATACLLVLFANRIRGLRMGVIVSALFILDPYIQRINRRSMLETATIFFVVLALYLFSRADEVRSRWRWLGPGTAFGLALLVKEPAAIFLLVPIAYSLLGNRKRLGDACRMAVTAAIFYSSYVFALAVTGDAGRLWAYQSYNFQRILHVLVDWKLGASPSGGTLQTAHKVYSAANLLMLIRQYASSYLLIVMALAGIVILAICFSRDKFARLLAVWMAVSVASDAVLIVVSDQYSYYSIVPALMVDGYLLDSAIGQWQRASARHAVVGRWWHVSGYKAVAAISALALATCAVFGGYEWFTNYGAGSDDCYSKIAAYVQENIQPGQTIESSNEVSNYFLAGRYNVRMDRTPSVLVGLNAHLFILSSRDLWENNQGTTPTFYNWVTQHSRPLLTCYDKTYWKLGLYYRETATTAAPPAQPKSRDVP